MQVASLENVEGFYIKYKAVKERSESDRTDYNIQIVHSASTTQYIIAGLRPYTIYDVCVQPVSQLGYLSTDTCRRARTLEDGKYLRPCKIEYLFIAKNYLS